MSKVLIYTPSDFACPYCKQAKAMLERRGVHFEEVQLASNEEEKWAELTKRSGMQTVPQIFYEQRLIGGYSELAELDKKDQLQSLK